MDTCVNKWRVKEMIRINLIQKWKGETMDWWTETGYMCVIIVTVTTCMVYLALACKTI